MKRSVLLAVVLAGLIFAVISYVWAEKAGEVTAKAEKACELLAKARVAYKAKKYKQVIECCSEALKINPKLKNARYSRGLAYYCLGKYDKAQSDFIRVLHMLPGRGVSVVDMTTPMLMSKR
jgi:tetratricopeptide (TPR) repeat protein